ncbi:hypothetical protein [Haloplasma contractile]|uniref:Uncharacterized protein n=1 Tax=Haloplasma contractile SSD-17B TaxID=1033810 RepID=F7PV04_9MOLU|nr:hypothetical protein [Haloplasma contractile]ERJ11239.1 hypothetical protein HLPCO_002679 [Haloplasma contractile SSD-17B]
MKKQYGLKPEWKDHHIYHVFYKHAKDNESGDQVEWLEDPKNGEIVGISIPLKDGTYKTYRRMFKGYDQITREVWEDMFKQAE